MKDYMESSLKFLYIIFQYSLFEFFIQKDKLHISPDSVIYLLRSDSCGSFLLLGVTDAFSKHQIPKEFLSLFCSLTFNSKVTNRWFILFISLAVYKHLYLLNKNAFIIMWRKACSIIKYFIAFRYIILYGWI